MPIAVSFTRRSRAVVVALPLAAWGLVVASPARADDAQAWGTASVTVGLGGPWRVSNETVVRTSDSRGLYEVENSLLLAYKASKQVTVASGYTHAPAYSHGSFTGMERRIRSQVVVDNFATVGPVRVSGRMRLETRWRDNVEGTGWRLRPYVKASLPLHGKTALNLSNETFVNLGRTSFQKVDGLERMRAALTVSTPLAKNVTVEGGYLYQHGFVRRGADSHDHVATVSLSASF